jgi:UDP-glucose 4-epimerase
VTDAGLLERLFREQRFDYVFHLAAYAAEGLSHFIRRFNYENNLIGSVNLINAAVRHEVDCFVFASSIAVYGRNQLPMTEELTPQPEDPYGIAKYAVELDLRAAHELFGLEFIVFRPHNVFGERQNIADPYRNVVGIFMNCILRNEPLPIFGDGEQTRAFSYIGDVAPVMAEAVTRPAARNQVFNIGADRSCSINELARLVSGAMGAEFRPRHLPERFEVKHAWPSHDKAARLLDFKPRHTLEQGIERMAAWVKTAGARRGRPFEKLELTKNLPAIWRELTQR